jgi:PKD repeat protein
MTVNPDGTFTTSGTENSGYADNGSGNCWICPPGVITCEFDDNLSHILSGVMNADKTVMAMTDSWSGANGTLTPEIAVFTKSAGSLTVTIGPSAAVNAGAMWNVDRGSWQTSGTTVSGITVGSHTVAFNNIAGWTTPSSQTFNISNGTTTSLSGVYVQRYTQVYAAGFTASRTSGKGPLAVHFSYSSTGSATKWFWNFGDGKTSKVPNPSHTYNKAGAYTVTLTVTGAWGTCTCTQPGCITVYAEPKANFSATPRWGDAPLPVNFINESTGIFTSWLWNFGDGSTSTDENPAHTYNSPGTHKAKLTVYGPGGSGSKTMSITVKK